MGREDQVEEREVLESIFPEEITDLSESEFDVLVTLELPHDPSNSHPAPKIIVRVQYPENYPDEAPHLDLLAPPSSLSHPYFNVTEDRDKLLAGLQSTIDDNLGMAMVFTLLTELKDAAEQLVIERREAEARAHDEAIEAAEREENKKFQGTPVTPETFMRWRDAFLREMEGVRRKAEDERRLADAKRSGGGAKGVAAALARDEKRLTGKQLWERGMIGKDDEDDGNGDGDDGRDELAKDVERLDMK